jgi:cyclopropane-fatty-acyl-phospholipid synthase
MLGEQQHSRDNGAGMLQPKEASQCYSDPEGRFAVVDESGTDVQRLLRMDAYTAANAFIDGRIGVRGDLFAAIRNFSVRSHPLIGSAIVAAMLKLRHLTDRLAAHGRREAAANIQFHYDRSNEFYSQFLDARMQYSAAHFSHPDESLREAQIEKLDRICRALVLCTDERFLDIGCGWGGLITYAAAHFGVNAEGCTLSNRQLEFATEAARRDKVQERVTVHFRDYRDLNGQFDKIASVGMFEHVGHAQLAAYFKKVHSLLGRRGLFLNRGIVRPQGVEDGAETLFLEKNVFPGGELVHLDDVVREGERAGFEVVAMEDFRLNYALTCRAWVRNLEARAETCRRLVGDVVYRTWLLYLAASAVSFEDGHTGAAQVLFAKR